MRIVASWFLVLAVWSSVAAAAPDPAACMHRWAISQGTIHVGTPFHQKSVRRYSEPCALRAEGAGSFVLDTTPNGLSEHVARFYFFPEAAAETAVQFFSAIDSGANRVYGLRLIGERIEVIDRAGAVLGSVPARISGWNSIELRWKAGSPGVLEAEFGMFAANSAGGRNVATIVRANTGSASDRVYAAALGIIEGGSGAVAHFDAYKSRTKFAERVGRVCRCDANGDGSINVFDTIGQINERLYSVLNMGQPDCNEDGVVNVFDNTIATALRLNGFTACPTP